MRLPQACSGLVTRPAIKARPTTSPLLTRRRRGLRFTDGYSADQKITFSDLDSEVPNRDRGDGCTFLDLVWAQAPFADHGGFVAAVEMVKDDYEAAFLITGREGGTIMVTAAQATDAWREGPPDRG